MNIKYLTLILTRDCNQDCSYCYQIKNNSSMNIITAKKAVNYIIKNCNGNPDVRFYGGEPLLEYELMKDIIEYTKLKTEDIGAKPTFSMTANGTLLDYKKLSYFADENVEICLSLDGIREAHEGGRGEGCFSKVMENVSLLKSFSGFPFKINMVVTPKTLIYLEKSVRFLLSLDTDELTLNFQNDCDWNEEDIELLHDLYEKVWCLLCEYKSKKPSFTFGEKYQIPPNKFFSKCNAGKEGLVITPEGWIYGCIMHVPWSKVAEKNGTVKNFQGLCLGNVDAAFETDIANRVDSLYSDRRLYGQIYRYTSTGECCDCEYITRCNVCPIYPVIYGDDPFLIPDTICKINKVIFDVIERYN